MIIRVLPFDRASVRIYKKSLIALSIPAQLPGDRNLNR